jgi:hypothetical protein
MWNCQCCFRDLPNRAIAHVAVTEEGERVDVGSDCIKKIKASGTDGYQKDGPVLYSIAAYEQLEASAE